MGKMIRVIYAPTGTVLAEGPLGWGITPFEGNLYIRKKDLRTDAIRPNFVPGICFYKFLYMWMDLRLPGEQPSPFIGWKYVLPNPLFPFIWFRTALLGTIQSYGLRSSTKVRSILNNALRSPGRATASMRSDPLQRVRQVGPMGGVREHHVFQRPDRRP
jgi:hypothetical protein